MRSIRSTGRPKRMREWKRAITSGRSSLRWGNRKMDEKLILHEYAASGNCYKVRLTAAIVGKHLERREYDITRGETRTPQFLWEVNANGRIPVLQVDHRFIPESNAACYYIADGSSLIPTDGFDHADMLRW